MREIPESVMNVAREIFQQQLRDNPSFHEIELIAAGIMAERERCARVAEAMSERHTGAKAIAAAIRAGEAEALSSRPS